MTTDTNKIDDNHVTVLGTFARAVRFTNVESVIYFMEKPHKWQAEFDKWNELDQPTSEADDNWDAWQAFFVGTTAND